MTNDVPILFEDEFFLVINKPAGLVVNRAESVREPTLQDWMESHSWFGKWSSNQIGVEENAEEVYASRSGMVHRLDKDTSGVLVFAKTPKSMFELMRQFRDRETQKTYLALAHGNIQPKSGSIKLPLGRSTNDRQKFTIDPEGKESETMYSVLTYYAKEPRGLNTKDARSYQGFSYVELHPKTGRTHQLRVHMSHIHHPLVSDTKYAGRKKIRIDETWCPRLFLHAKQLILAHPETHAVMTIDAPLAADLEQVLQLFTS